MLVFCLIVMRFGTAALLAATATPETPRAMHRPAAPTASLRFFIRVLSWCGRPAPTLRPDVSEWVIYRVSSRTFLVAPIAVAPPPLPGFGRVLLTRQRERCLAGLLDVSLLDRPRPLEELSDLGLAGLLGHHARDLDVSQLAGLGHDQELEPVERVGVAAEVGLHHLGGLALRLASLLLQRRLLALQAVRDLLAALLGLGGFLRHLVEHPLQLVGCLRQSGDLRRRVLCRLREADHFAELLFELREFRHGFLSSGWREVVREGRE